MLCKSQLSKPYHFLLALLSKERQQRHLCSANFDGSNSREVHSQRISQEPVSLIMVKVKTVSE